MRILMITTAFPRWPGDDRGVFIHAAAQALSQQGIKVRVLGIHSPKAKTQEMMGEIEVVRTRYLPERWEVLQSQGGGLPEVWKKQPLARLALIPFVIMQAVAIIRYSLDIDIIQANWTLSGFLAWVTKVIHRKPYIVTLHGSDVNLGGKIKFAKGLIAPSLKNAAAVVAVSDSLAKSAKKIFSLDKEVIVIPDGVDTEFFHPPASSSDREDAILFVGALTTNKGVHLLLEAFLLLQREIASGRLVMIGEGPEIERLRERICAANMKERVLILGSCTQHIVADWMRNSRMLVLPSFQEGLGVVLLEAAASGTPSIGSRTGGIPEIIGDDAGLLFTPGNVEDLRSAILQLWNDQTMWEQMSHQARNKAVQFFDWQNVARRLMILFKSILNY